MRQISVEEARELLRGDDPPLLLDCREGFELSWCVLPGAVHIPLMEIPERAPHELPVGRPVLVYCHHGVRSINGAILLEHAGFEAMSMRGGIDAWSLRIDPSVPRY